MSRAIIPTSQLQRRLPEAGRIRTGVKKKTSGGKERPAAIPEFRFTSHDQQALTQIADMYGGTVRPWSDAKAAAGQYEVITEASEIRVVLPPDPLGGTPVYELWGGGGCERRCNGVDCTILQQGPDGLEPTEVACLCDARGEMACNVITRLTVILPEVRFAGVWRLDTKSWNAAQELPGMVDMVQQIQSTGGLAYATLTLKQRRSVAGGRTRNFIVPMLGIPQTVEQLAAGQARLGALPPSEPQRMALAAGSPGEVEQPSDAVPPAELGETATPAVDAPSLGTDDDDEVVDAEIVDDPVAAAPVEAGSSTHLPGSNCSLCGEEYGSGGLVKGHDGESRFVHVACREGANTDPMQDSQQRHIFAELRTRKIAGPERHRWASDVLGREVSSFTELTAGDADVLIRHLRENAA